MGDGVLVYFGYPRSHEDDAERAGLGVIDAVGRLDVKSVELQARVGIATGLVVVGDLIGEGSAQEHVDTQEYFIHTAANRNVEACQQARQVQVQSSFLRYLENMRRECRPS